MVTQEDVYRIFRLLIQGALCKECRLEQAEVVRLLVGADVPIIHRQLSLE